MPYSQSWLEDNTRARGLLVVAKRKIAVDKNPPTLFLDFINSTALDSSVTFTRPTTATYINSRGVLTTAALNSPRFDYDPATLQPLGLLIEGGRTNSVRNNTMVGAAAGTPGTVPTNWTVQILTTTGLTRSVVGTGTEDGISYIDLRLNGTAATANGNFQILFETTTGIAAASAQVWTTSCYVKLMGVDLTGISNPRVTHAEYSSAPAFLTSQSTTVALPTSASLKTQRIAATHTLSNASTASVVGMYQFAIATGSVIDVTLRIGLPQTEQGAFASSVIPTTTAAVARTADIALINTLTPWFNATNYALYYEGMTKSYNPAGSSVFISVGDTFDNTVYLYQASSGLVSGIVRSGAAQTANMTTTITPTSGVTFQAAMNVTANNFSISANACTPAVDTAGAVPVSNVRLGIGNAGWLSTGGSQGQQWVQKIGFYAQSFTSSEVQNLSGLEDTVYLSNMGFITTDGNTVFNPIIVKDLALSENLGLDGEISVSYGDLELSNPNGELDDWLDYSKYIWSNRAIKIYYGDPEWPLDTIANIGSVFDLIFDGVIDECKSRNRNTVNLTLRDKQERLNGPVTERIIGTTGTWSGGQTNQDNTRPLILGEVFNISPILIDPSTLTYLFNDGECEGLIEIRDNGYPIYTAGGTLTGATVNNTTGTFTLTSPASGAITCSVQGVKYIDSVYTNNITEVIRLLAISYGQPTKRFLPSEIDITTSITAGCGYAVLDRENLLSVMQKLAKSIGCQIYINRKGLLQLLRLGVPFTATDVTAITTSDIIQGTLSISNKTDTLGSIKMAYCKNWTVQNNLTTAVPDSSKESFSSEWLVETVKDAVTISMYKLTSDPVQRESYLIKTTEAFDEATRLLSYYKVAKTVYSFTGTTKLIGLKLGQQVTITHPRFGLSPGKIGQVISLNPNWTKGSIEVEVIV